MPFTLAHPAAVLPLLRQPFVPVALIAGSMAPDTPYFLTAIGIRSTHAGDWYGSFLNATTTHSLHGLPIDLLYAVLLVGVYWLLQAPITALGLRLPKLARPNVLWLAVSALIGAGTHLLWDFLTDADFVPAPRLLQYASTAFGLIVIAWFAWRHRAQLRSPDTTTPHTPDTAPLPTTTRLPEATTPHTRGTPPLHTTASLSDATAPHTPATPPFPTTARLPEATTPHTSDTPPLPTTPRLSDATAPHTRGIPPFPTTARLPEATTPHTRGTPGLHTTARLSDAAAPHTPDTTRPAGTTRLPATTRRLVVALLIAAPLLAAAVLAPADYSNYQEASDTWTGIAEGVFTGAVKRAGAAFALALVLYATTWHLIRPRRRPSNWTTTWLRRSS